MSLWFASYFGDHAAKSHCLLYAIMIGIPMSVSSSSRFATTAQEQVVGGEAAMSLWFASYFGDHAGKSITTADMRGHFEAFFGARGVDLSQAEDTPDTARKRWGFPHAKHAHANRAAPVSNAGLATSQCQDGHSASRANVPASL